MTTIVRAKKNWKPHQTHIVVLIAVCGMEIHDLKFKTIEIVRQISVIVEWKMVKCSQSPTHLWVERSVSILCFWCEWSVMKTFLSSKTKAFLYSHRYQVFPINTSAFCIAISCKKKRPFETDSEVNWFRYERELRCPMCQTKNILIAFSFGNRELEKITLRQPIQIHSIGRKRHRWPNSKNSLYRHRNRCFACENVNRSGSLIIFLRIHKDR